MSEMYKITNALENRITRVKGDRINMEMLELLDVESEDLNKELKDCGIKPLKPLKTND